MKVKTYFWHDRVIPSIAMKARKLFDINPSRYFTIGNAGDIFSETLLKHVYGLNSLNTSLRKKRLLCIGSISSKIKVGDIICGVGHKNPSENLKYHPNCKVHGLRGPLSYEVFKKSGYKVDDIKFLLDPGLLIRHFVDQCESYKKNKVSILPHYRERFLIKRSMNNKYSFIDIDNNPIKVAKKILESEAVYTSSLHGIIFCHALGRPCAFVKPSTNEPLFKYKDYYESVSLKYVKPVESFDAIKPSQIGSSITKNYNFKDFYFPNIEELKDEDIVI